MDVGVMTQVLPNSSWDGSDWHRRDACQLRLGDFKISTHCRVRAASDAHLFYSSGVSLPGISHAV